MSPVDRRLTTDESIIDSVGGQVRISGKYSPGMPLRTRAPVARGFSEKDTKGLSISYCSELLLWHLIHIINILTFRGALS